MSDYDKEAKILQDAVRSDEAVMEDKGISTYSDEAVKRAIVHAREDIVLITSYLTSANDKLEHLKKTNKYIFLGMCFLIGFVVAFGFEYLWKKLSVGFIVCPNCAVMF